MTIVQILCSFYLWIFIFTLLLIMDSTRKQNSAKLNKFIDIFGMIWMSLFILAFVFLMILGILKIPL